DPEPSERSEDALADHGSVLADAAAERDRVEAAEHRRIGADVLADSHAKALERERSPGLPVRLGSQQHADIIREPGEPEQPRAAVETVFDLLPLKPRARQMNEHARVDIAAPGAHHEPFERREAHARVDG